jgi:hypothetical protein
LAEGKNEDKKISNKKNHKMSVRGNLIDMKYIPVFFCAIISNL